jgi:hypothetical protein
MSQPERGGVVVIRVWIEEAHPSRLRARITLTADVQDGETESVVASTPEAVVEVVRGYLDAFLLMP